MKSIAVAFVVLFSYATVSAQFESLEDKSSPKDKLDHYFIQADEFANSYAVAFRIHKVIISDKSGDVKERNCSGMTIKSSKHKLEYYCYDYDRVFNPPTSMRAESLRVGTTERRRAYSTETGSTSKSSLVEPDPKTGLRSEEKSKDYFSDLANEIDPYGLVLAATRATRARNSSLDKVLKLWITNLELKSEREEKGLLITNWNGEGREENSVGRRELIFDSRVGYLPITSRVYLADQNGKKVISEVRTVWDEFKPDKWRPSKSIVSYTFGQDKYQEEFEFAWAESVDLEAFLAKQDWKAILADENKEWFELFSEGLSRRKSEVKL
jgi:hypothetical protein